MNHKRTLHGMVLNALGLLLPLLVSLLPSIATADAPAFACGLEERTMPTPRILRSLSLDIRGRPPSLAEYREAQMGVSVETFVDRWLDSEDFADRVVRRHRSLVWNNVGANRILPINTQLQASGGRYFIANRTRQYRGDPSICDDIPATIVDGQVQYRNGVNSQGQANRIEGYVEVHPWWAPDTTVKVCAFDAQEAAISPAGFPCDSTDGLNDRSCGCGPNLDRCWTAASHSASLSAIGRDVDLRVRAMILEHESYLSLFRSRRAFVNGPLVKLLRDHASSNTGTAALRPVPYDLDTLPNLDPSAADEYVEVQLPEEHAGILTSPAFLLRFQTRRARAARFYDAFLCRPFQPPPGGIPASTEDEARIADLQVRPGCGGCHTFLEPAGAYWGRWSEYGIVHLTEELYPATRNDCSRCARGQLGCSADCNTHYLTRALSPDEEPYLGQFKPLAFRRAVDRSNIDLGPRALIDAAVAEGSLPLCSAKHAFEWFLGRDAETEDAAFIESMARTFAQSDFDYRNLVKTMLLSPAYRTVQ